jgi:hypothetical protein
MGFTFLSATSSCARSSFFSASGTDLSAGIDPQTKKFTEPLEHYPVLQVAVYDGVKSVNKIIELP